MADIEETLPEESESDADRFWKEFDDKESGKEPVAEETATEQEDVPAEDAPEEAPSEDQPADPDQEQGEGEPEEPETPPADDDAKSALEEAKAQLAKYEHEVKSHRGRQTALQREIDELKALIKGNGKAEPEGKEPAKEEDFFSGEDWQKFQTEYDEVAKPIRSAIERMVTPLKSHITDLHATIERLNAERMHEQVEILEKDHPEYDNFLREHADEFNFWINNLARVQDYRIYESNYKQIQNGRQTSEMLGRFKSYLSGANGEDKAPVVPSQPAAPKSVASVSPQAAPLSSKRTSQLRSALAPRSKPQTPSIGTEIPGPNDPSAENHWRYFERMEKERGL